MAHAYTPGLRVAELTTIRKLRRLPLAGEVLVQQGDRVEAQQIVASTSLPGNVQSVNVANKLGCSPGEIAEYMRFAEGDGVQQGDLLAETKGLWGFFKASCEAPIAGTVETISGVTGQVLLRGEPLRVELPAYLDGTVVEVLPNEGVAVEAEGAFVQGIFGLGGETFGLVRVVAESPEAPLTAAMLDDSCRGAVVVGGSLITGEGLRAALEVGAAGVVAGGIEDSEVDAFLGYPLGVAITGQEERGITVIVTEGFGRMAMAPHTFELLKSREGQRASINGATQIRAGVIRPEIVIPAANGQRPEGAQAAADEGGVTVGSPIRIIREPYFGLLATVSALPEALQQVETEAHVRVLAARLDDGREVVIPRANVELIQG